MSILKSVRTGPTNEPPRLLIYGTEKVGKTTFLANCPGAITITSEDGGGDLDYARVVVTTWSEVLAVVESLMVEHHHYTTLGLDSVTSLQDLLFTHICVENDASSIEAIGGGFGKGFTLAAEEMRRLLARLDALRTQRRMSIIGLAHSHVRPASDPGAAAPYDRYELRLDKRIAGQWTSWVDGIMFACIDAVVVTASASKRAKADPNAKGRVVGDGNRVLCTVKSAAYDAGVRWKDIPEELPLTWSAFSSAFRWSAREEVWLGNGPQPTKPEMEAWAAAVKRLAMAMGRNFSKREELLAFAAEQGFPRRNARGAIIAATKAMTVEAERLAPKPSDEAHPETAPESR